MKAEFAPKLPQSTSLSELTVPSISRPNTRNPILSPILSPRPLAASASTDTRSGPLIGDLRDDQRREICGGCLVDLMQDVGLNRHDKDQQRHTKP